MSLEMRVFVPAVDDAMIPRWMERLNRLGMRCEIDPEFSFKNHSGFLPFRVAIERSAHAQLIGTDFLTGFEFYMDDFNLQHELEAIRPKLTLIGRLTGRKQDPVFFATPEVDQQLASCAKVLSLVWGVGDTLELRMATVSAAILAELTDGVCSYPADSIWYAKEGAVEKAVEEAEGYEASLKPRDLRLHRFEGWNR